MYKGSTYRGCIMSNYEYNKDYELHEPKDKGNSNDAYNLLQELEYSEEE